MRFAYARGAQQQHGRDLQAIAAALGQGHLAAHVVEHFGEVGQLLVQGRHVGQAGGFDLEALGAALEHAFVHRAQRFMVALRAGILQPGQLARHVGRVEHAAHLGHRQAQGRGLRYKAVAGHLMLSPGQWTQPFKHSGATAVVGVIPHRPRRQKKTALARAVLARRGAVSPGPWCPAPAAARQTRTSPS